MSDREQFLAAGAWWAPLTLPLYLIALYVLWTLLLRPFLRAALALHHARLLIANRPHNNRHQASGGEGRSPGAGTHPDRRSA